MFPFASLDIQSSLYSLNFMCLAVSSSTENYFSASSLLFSIATFFNVFDFYFFLFSDDLIGICYFSGEGAFLVVDLLRERWVLFS